MDKKVIFEVFGFMLGLGALLGAAGSLIAGLCEKISNAYPTGFWEWVGLFFGCALLFSIFAGIFGIGEGMISMMDCSVGLAILVAICSFTTGAATVGGRIRPVLVK